MIKNSGERLSNLINDLLDLSLIKHNKIKLNIKALDLHLLSQKVLSLLKPLLFSKNIQFVNEINNDLYILADENRTEQIFYNIIGNAIKFTDVGEIKVSARKKSDFIEISVSDTGIGIPEEKHKDIFKSFEQADNSTGKYYGGTGIGLSITKNIVEQHGGKISVESESGVGTKFVFSLPLADENPKIETSEEIHSLQRVSSHQAERQMSDEIYESDAIYTILTIDDEFVNQQVLKNHLSLQNFFVEQVYNGEQAFEYLEKNENPDLILLDIMMPGISGYEVCRKIREKYSSADLPIIMLTAKNQIADLVEGFKAGANDFIPKPFSKNELISRIKSHIELAEKIDGDKTELRNEILEIKEIQKDMEQKYGQNRLSDETVEQLGKILKDVMQKEKPYIYENISLTTLSERLPVTTRELSQVINRKFGLTFHSFVNYYRVEEMKKILKDPANKNENIIQLSYRVGFKSKTSFNTIFKKGAGVTPSQYRKSHSL